MLSIVRFIDFNFPFFFLSCKIELILTQCSEPFETIYIYLEKDYCDHHGKHDSFETEQFYYSGVILDNLSKKYDIFLYKCR